MQSRQSVAPAQGSAGGGGGGGGAGVPHKPAAHVRPGSHVAGAQHGSRLAPQTGSAQMPRSQIRPAAQAAPPEQQGSRTWPQAAGALAEHTDPAQVSPDRHGVPVVQHGSSSAPHAIRSQIPSSVHDRPARQYPSQHGARSSPQDPSAAGAPPSPAATRSIDAPVFRSMVGPSPSVPWAHPAPTRLSAAMVTSTWNPIRHGCISPGRSMTCATEAHAIHSAKREHEKGRLSPPLSTVGTTAWPEYGWLAHPA